MYGHGMAAEELRTGGPWQRSSLSVFFFLFFLLCLIFFLSPSSMDKDLHVLLVPACWPHLWSLAIHVWTGSFPNLAHSLSSLVAFIAECSSYKGANEPAVQEWGQDQRGHSSAWVPAQVQQLPSQWGEEDRGRDWQPQAIQEGPKVRAAQLASALWCLPLHTTPSPLSLLLFCSQYLELKKIIDDKRSQQRRMREERDVSCLYVGCPWACVHSLNVCHC